MSEGDGALGSGKMCVLEVEKLMFLKQEEEEYLKEEDQG